jgi:uncharacterized damage-inducible protein DinB
MKEVFLSFAKYNEEANRAFLSIMDKLSNDEREKERGSYYGSLSGIARHLLGGEVFFLQVLFKTVVEGNSAAQKALESVEGLVVPKEKLDESQWKSLVLSFAAANGALVNFVSALSDSDYKAPVDIGKYGGNPASEPLYFLLQQLAAHGTHHRGQISQILDELKIDNDYSEINAKFLV